MERAIDKAEWQLAPGGWSPLVHVSTEREGALLGAPVEMVVINLKIV